MLSASRWMLLLCVVCVHGVQRPPMITKQPPRLVYFKPGEKGVLPCEGNGEPWPTFTWIKNDARVIQIDNSGTLVFNKVNRDDAGAYRCMVGNDYGVAVSGVIFVEIALLETFWLYTDSNHSVSVGMPLELICPAPTSLPRAEVVWIVNDELGNVEVVKYSARVTMEEYYSLKFANVIQEDSRNGRSYSCVVTNTILGKSEQGPRHFINVEGQTPDFQKVQYMGDDQSGMFGLRGWNFTYRCMFSGYPTPEVHWGRTDNKSFSSRVQLTMSSTKLVIQNLQYEDAGGYECWAVNVASGEESGRQIFNLRVSGAPRIIQKPENVETGVGATVEFHCKVEADPPAPARWFRNGRKLIEPSLRFKIGIDTIRIENVQVSDTMVITCNGSNLHGRALANAYLNVIAGEAPIIVTPPIQSLVSVEGLALNLTCGTTGEPDPIITWYKDGVQVTGGRYQILLNGDLHIQHLVLADAAHYRCEARNIYNTTSAEGTLVVRKKTRIVLRPYDVETTAGQDARFTCSGTTDPEELHNLQILWLKDGKAIMSNDRRMMTNYQNTSLTVNETITGDSGTYTCLVTNGVDSATASAVLSVIAGSHDDESNIGWFVGTVLAILLVVGLLIILIVCYKRKFQFHQTTKTKCEAGSGHKPVYI